MDFDGFKCVVFQVFLRNKDVLGLLWFPISVFSTFLEGLI